MLVVKGDLMSSKNSKRILKTRDGRLFIAKSEQALKGEKAITSQLNLQRDKWQEMVKQQRFPMALRFKIYRQTRRRFDYVNIVQSLLDVMVDLNMLPDDSADHIIPVFDQYEVDPGNPRTEVTIIGQGSEIVLRKAQADLFG